MNGKIWVESKEGQGSTFFFTIDATTAPSLKTRPRLEARLDLRDKRILIVDDNSTNRRILSLQFQAWSMQPRSTPSPNEALQWLRQGETFDAAVLDLEMEEMDGLHSGQRNTPAAPGPQSANHHALLSLEQSEPRGRPVVSRQFFAKPVKASQSIQCHNRYLRRRDGRYPSPEWHRSYRSSIPRWAVRHPLRILLVEDNPINQNLILLMMERMGYRADVAGNGLEAYEALRRQPYDVVFMDIQMPEMDGLRLRARSARSSIAAVNRASSP